MFFSSYLLEWMNEWMKIAIHKKNHENFCCILFAVKPICKVAKQISQAFMVGK